MRALATISVLAALAGTAFGQQSTLKLNEILVNAEGEPDEECQYIELFGCPNTSLEDLAIIVIDSYDDDGTLVTEIDECWYFSSSKYKTDQYGYFVLWNSGSNSQTPSTARASSQIYAELPEDLSQINEDNSTFNSANPRWEACFEEVRNTDGENCGNIKNNGSKTFLLVDLSLSTNVSLAEIRKDVACDTNSDSELDGDLQNLYVIDQFAWSHDGGKEYTTNEADEWDFAAGWNPEGASRVDTTSTGYDQGTRFIEDESSNSDDFRQVYRNWQAGEFESDFPNLSYTDGFGYAPRPTSTMSPNNVTEVDDDNGSPASYGVLGISQTPGTANQTNQVASGCRVPGSADQNSDGVVNFLDMVEAANAGDAAAVRNIIRSMR